MSFLDGMLELAAQLEHEGAGDAQEAPGVGRGCPQSSTVDDEDVRSGRLAQLAHGVQEDGFGGAVLVRVRARARTFSA